MLPSCLVWKNHTGKNFEEMLNGVDKIPACDRQMDRQISCDGIVRAMHTCRATKIIPETNGEI